MRLKKKHRESHANSFVNDVFFSYARVDDIAGAAHLTPSTIRDEVRAYLKAEIVAPCSTKIWRDRDDMQIGGSLVEEILDALTSTAVIVVCLSRAYLASPWCRRELEQFATCCAWPETPSLNPDRIVLISLDATGPANLMAAIPNLANVAPNFAATLTCPGYSQTAGALPTPLLLNGANLTSANGVLPNLTAMQICQEVGNQTLAKLKSLRSLSPAVFLGHINRTSTIKSHDLLAKLERNGVRAEYLDLDPQIDDHARELLLSNLIGDCDVFFEVNTGIETEISFQNTYENQQRLVFSQNTLPLPLKHVLWGPWSSTPITAVDRLDPIELKGITEPQVIDYVIREAYRHKFWSGAHANARWDLLLVTDPQDLSTATQMDALISLANIRRGNLLPPEGPKPPLVVYSFERDIPPGEYLPFVLLPPEEITNANPAGWRRVVNLYGCAQAATITARLAAWTANSAQISLDPDLYLWILRFCPPATTNPLLLRPPRSREFVIDNNPTHFVDELVNL